MLLLLSVLVVHVVYSKIHSVDLHKFGYLVNLMKYQPRDQRLYSCELTNCSRVLHVAILLSFILVAFALLGPTEVLKVGLWDH